MRKEKELSNSGHTFIELIVTLAIVSVLVFAAIPLFESYMEDSKIDELQATILKAATAQEKYFVSTGQYAATPSSLGNYGFPTDINDKMKLYTGLVFRQNVGMTYWVAGNYDIDPHVSDAYNECWIYFGSVLGTGGSDNFMRLHKEIGNVSTDISGCGYCPALNDVCK